MRIWKYVSFKLGSVFRLCCNQVFKRTSCLCRKKGCTVFAAAFFKTSLSCQTWCGYICNCRSIGLFWPELGAGNTPRAVFDTSVNLITIKQGGEKKLHLRSMKYRTVSPSQLFCHSTRLRHDECHKWAKMFRFGELISAEKVYTNQHGRSLCLFPLKVLWVNKSGDSMLPVSERSVQHKLGCGFHRLASPALSNHSDMARPQACCPNSTLAPGKVEAEGTHWLKAHPQSYPRDYRQ